IVVGLRAQSAALSTLYGFSPASTSASLLRQSLRLRMSDSAANASSAAHRPSSAAAIGRWKKIAQLPFDMINDWRSDISKVGAITRPSTIGAGSNPDLRQP